MVSSGLAIKPTTDVELIKSLCTHPKVWSMLRDDFTAEPQNWNPPMHGQWLAAIDDEGEVMGLFCLLSENHVCLQAHILMLPKFWGAQTLEATQAMYRWVWKNTTAMRIVGSIPVDNPLAITLAIRSGMERQGVNPKSFQRKGQLLDQVLLGISRPQAMAAEVA